MYVQHVKDYDDFSYEADIIVTDGTFELLCYCYPAELYKVGTHVKEISSLFAKDIMRVSSNEYLIMKLDNDHYAYHLQGEVVETARPIIRIGDLEIILDTPFAKDIKLGEFVELEVYRLNCAIE